MEGLEGVDKALGGLIFLKIKHSVGKGGSNRYDDVQRIQFLLNVIHVDPGNGFRMPALLAMDGICGQRTKAAILGYQEYKQFREFPLAAVDGVITATHHAVFTNPRSFGFSTILNLNWDYLQAMPRANLAEVFVGAAMEPL
jgi:hypothetical protein